MKILFERPYGDWPDIKPGTIIEKPTAEMIRIAQSGSPCLTLIPDEAPVVGAEGIPPITPDSEN